MAVSVLHTPGGTVPGVTPHAAEYMKLPVFCIADESGVTRVRSEANQG
jgi:hypothetical protein